MDADDGGYFCSVAEVQEDLAGQLVVDTTTLPLEVADVLLTAVGSDHLKLDVPEWFWFEVSDLLVALHNEAECWELAWTIADHVLGTKDLPEDKGLVSGEGCTDAEVDFLPEFDCVGEVFVWWGEGAHCLCEV